MPEMFSIEREKVSNENYLLCLNSGDKNLLTKVSNGTNMIGDTNNETLFINFHLSRIV